MVRRFVFSLLAGLCLAAPARAEMAMGGIVLDPKSEIRTELLSKALSAWEARKDARRDLIAVVDFAKASNQQRFYLLNLNTGAVEAYLTAHGQGSDPDHDGVADSFSNEANSHASSLGVFLTAKRYIGKHGLSLAMDGLDESNSNARARAIVLHSAPYMSEDFIRAHKRPGRSWGCFVVDPRYIDGVVQKLEGGVLIYAGR